LSAIRLTNSHSDLYRPIYNALVQFITYHLSSTNKVPPSCIQAWLEREAIFGLQMMVNVIAIMTRSQTNCVFNKKNSSALRNMINHGG